MFKEHVDALHIYHLRAALTNAGLQNGPITASTEAVYRALLVKYLTSLENETELNSTLNSSNSDREYIDSGSASDGEVDLDQASEVPVHETLAELPTIPKSQFTPIQWNPRIQRYEPVNEGSNSELTNEGDETHSKGMRKWLLLMALAVMLLAVVIAMIFLSSERDPYKSLEDAASHITTHGKLPAPQ